MLLSNADIQNLILYKQKIKALSSQLSLQRVQVPAFLGSYMQFMIYNLFCKNINGDTGP